MTSIRESIAVNIETVLAAHQKDGIQFAKVYRAPKDISELPRTAFPASVITSADETREDISMGSANITVRGIITMWIDLHVWGELRDQELNQLIDLVDTALDVDRTRGSVALDTVVASVSLLDPTSAAPYTSARMLVNIDYCYTRGQS